MIIESASIPLPSEIIMGIAGYLVYLGQLNLFLVALIGALGNTIGSTIMYFIGAKGGRPVVNKYGKYLHMEPERLLKVEKWFYKYGTKLIFISQLLPVIRTFISLPAGILKVNYLKFISYTFAGAFLWCLLLSYISASLGVEWKRITEYLKSYEVVIGGLLLIIVLIYLVRFGYYRLRPKLSNVTNIK